MNRRGKTIIKSADVLQTVVDIATSNPPRPATRIEVAKQLGVSYQLVDEHLNKLLEAKKVIRVLPGVYRPADVHPDKVISSTHVPGGRIKLDIDDVCIDLSLRDVQAIVRVLAGFALVPLDLTAFREQRFRECVYNGQAEMPSGGAITCQLKNFGDDGPAVAPSTPMDPASAPGIPKHKPMEKMWPPAGFQKIENG